VVNKYPNTYGFPSGVAGDETEGILVRIIIQLLNEISETNRLLRIVALNPNKGVTTTDNVDTTV